MATENECKGLKVLDPIEGLLDYIEDIKPFHTKVVEVLIEYAISENIEVSMSNDSNHKTHDLVTVNTANTEDIYHLPGGNYIQRLAPGLRVERYDETGFLDFEQPAAFEITNIAGNIITISGTYDYFFLPTFIMGVDVWHNAYYEMVIVSSSSAGGNTNIEVSPIDIARFQGLSTTFGIVRGAVYDPQNPSPPLNPTESLSYNFVDPQRITSATFKEDFKIDWGSVYAWTIISTNSGAGTITVKGDITDQLNSVIKMFITKSQGNDGTYDIVSHVFDLDETVITLTPTLPVDPDVGDMGFAQIEDVVFEDWFQFVVINANSTTNEFIVSGDVTNNILLGGEFRVIRTSNDGVYTATLVPTYDGGLNQSTIHVANIANDDTEGWIEHV